MNITQHAAIRTRQRGIPPIILDLLLEFGHHEFDHRGAEIIFFNKRSKKNLERHSSCIYSKISNHLNSYAVLDGNTVLTIGKRTKRIKRDR